MKEKYKKYKRITFTQIIHHNGIHVVDKYRVEETLIQFLIKEYEIHAKKITCDAMYILKCATLYAVLAKLSDLENITSEQLMKFPALLKFKQDK